MNSETQHITAAELDAAGVPRWYERLAQARREMNGAIGNAAYAAAGARFDETWRRIVSEYRHLTRGLEVVE